MNRSLALLPALVLLPLQAVQAQAQEQAPDSDDYRVRVGLGAQTRPEYIGADKNQFAPLLDMSIKRGTEPFNFKAPDDNFGIAVVRKNGFAFGPVANIQSGRKNKDVGIDIGRIKTTIELGGFAQYELSTSTRLRAEVRKGLGGHRGLVASLGADQVWRDGDKWQFSVGPRVSFSDGRYQRAWFGVDDAAAIATPLPFYRPGAGIHSVGATSGMYYSFGRSIGMFGFGRAERLVGDAADSPLIKGYGSKTQLSAGLGLTYTFSVAR
ncbi:MAG: MipA/OmpV family protein [Sphingomicrobium sp.]